MSDKIKNIFLLCLMLALINPHLMPYADKVGPKGNSAYPLMNRFGELVFVYKNPDLGMGLAIRNEYSGEYSEYPLLNDQDISSPIIKEDKKGDNWVVWEKASYERNDIYCAKLSQNEIVDAEVLSNVKAFHHSPDLDFDNENNPWITWIAYLDSECSVLVKNLMAERTWILNKPRIESAHSPKIVIDRANTIWIFWTGNHKGRDEIFYCTFRGTQWALPSKLNSNDTVPHLFPEVDLGPNGFPWVVWAAYDGNDYEIQCAAWNGNGWTEEKITDNGESDSYPVISFISGSVPIVIWSRLFESGSGIYCRYKDGDVWTSEKELYKSDQNINFLPKIAVQDSQIGITWQSGDEIRSQILSFIEIEEIERHTISEKMGSVFVTAELDENAYIGFGNSITYGMLDYQYTPELGYIPRLESVLNENFGPSKVINEGWPGEVTHHGLGRMGSVIAKHNAGYLLLMEGTNDIIFNYISIDATTFHLKEMIRICRNYGVFVVLSTIIPRNDQRWRMPFYRDRIFRLNDKIRDLAKEVKVPLVDMFNIFYNYPESEGGWTVLLSNDYVHPSIKGYEIMTESWFKEIQNLPFPPANVDANRVHDQVLDSVQEGNVVIWRISPKLTDEQSFRAYKIYRAKLGVQPLILKHLNTLIIRNSDASKMGFLDFPGLDTSGNNYLDAQIEPSSHYRYAISMVRRDGVEGPLSRIVQDNQ